MKLFTAILYPFLLLLFLFPQVEKGIHDYRHKNDFHCTSNSKHIHEQEHVCSLCDFIAPETTTHSNFVFEFTLFISLSHNFSLYEAEVISSPAHFISLRAPPAVS